MVLLGKAHAAVEQVAVVYVGAADAGNGHEQVAADEADLVLHVALLVARVRVAEGVVEPVMGGESREHLGGPYGRAGLPADAGGVVEHYARWDAAAVLEYVAQALADALGVLAGEHLRQADVRVREGDDEVQHPPSHAADVEIGFAEVGLGLAGGPYQIEKRLLGFPALCLEAGDVVADGGLACPAAALVPEAGVYARGSVALLAP